jgi:hypothetical protein
MEPLERFHVGVEGIGRGTAVPGDGEAGTISGTGGISIVTDSSSWFNKGQRNLPLFLFRGMDIRANFCLLDESASKQYD